MTIHDMNGLSPMRLVFVVSLTICLVSGTLLAFEDNQEQMKRLAIEEVRAFASRWGIADKLVENLAAKLEPYPALPSIVVCRVLQGSTIHVGSKEHIISTASHPAEWILAFQDGELFKLAGFGRESEFRRLMKHVKKQIGNGETAFQQVLLYLDLVEGEQSLKIVGSRKALRSEVESRLSWAGKDVKLQTHKWMAGVPSFVLRRIQPPLQFESGGQFVVELFALTESPYDLSLYRYKFIVEVDGNVALQQKSKLNVPDWQN